METHVQEDILLVSSSTIFESIDDNFLLKLFNFWFLLNTKNPEYCILE